MILLILQIRNFLWYLRFWGGMQKTPTVKMSWNFLGFSNTPSSLSPVNRIQANQSLNQSILSPFPSILWPAMFKEHLIHLFTQFKDKIQCIHTLSAFEWGDLVFHTGPTFWSGSLSHHVSLYWKAVKAFLRKTAGTVFLKQTIVDESKCQG